MDRKFFAHSVREQPVEVWEPLIPHLAGTAKLAAGFADAFSCGGLGHAMGLLHDLGKYQEDFQRRIAPCAGAWIETHQMRAGTSGPRVAPCAGAWIETPPAP